MVEKIWESNKKKAGESQEFQTTLAQIDQILNSRADEDDNRPFIQMIISGIKIQKWPEEVVADLFEYLRKSAEIELGCFITQAVVTVPTYFNSRQR